MNYFGLFYRALEKNGSFGFFCIGSCDGKNQMCHLRVGFFTLTHNGYVYGVVWRFEAQTCQTATNFIKCNAFKISTFRPMIYTLCVCPAYTALHTWLSCFQMGKIQIFSKKTNLQVCFLCSGRLKSSTGGISALTVSKSQGG
jgi:hypothetical protein